jgi:CRP-like cAMP-binding protein
MKSIIDPDHLASNLDAPCFSHLLPEEADLIRGSKTQVLFHKGENLTKQGAFGSSILFIIKGLAKQYIEEGAQRNFNLRIIRQSEFIGLSVVFQNNMYDYSVMALKETLACLIEKEALAGLIRKNSEFAFGLMQRYSRQNSQMYATIRQVMYKQMHGRLADTLLYLGSAQFEAENIFSLLNRKDIADFAGLSTESTVKLLKSFEQDGLIRLEEKNIILLDPEALRRISRTG